MKSCTEKAPARSAASIAYLYINKRQMMYLYINKCQMFREHNEIEMLKLAVCVMNLTAVCCAQEHLHMLENRLTH